MCWKCGKPIELNGTISRSDVCPSCGADVRSCKNCRFYEPGAHYECRENIDELVKDKERANFCGWFMIAPQTEASGTSSSGANAGSSSSCAASDAFRALFGEKPAEKPSSSGKDAFNALFGD